MCPPLPSVVRYRLLAIDLDGTLLDPTGHVSAANIAAVHAAREAGARVVVCTGRGLVESAHILATIEQTDPVVVAGGSIIADPVTKHTLHRFSIAPAIVRRVAERLIAHRHPVLVLKDPAQTGFDYLIVQGRERLPLDPVTQWWFEKLRVRVQFAEHLDEDQHPDHTVRVGACGLSSVFAQLKADLADAAGDAAHIHHFPAVVGPEHASRIPPGESLHILELFDLAATKWSAITRLAQQWGIAHADIAAIGDEINDVSMIQGTARAGGLGVAMGNAVPIVKDIATRHTKPNADNGVAHAINQMLAGGW